MKEKEKTEDVSSALNRLKREVFFALLDLVGRVFIVVRHADNVVIGTRGFLPEEKENGIVLVLNSTMDFSWSDRVMRAKLIFGTTPQQCVIPEEQIVGIYSPEVRTQLLCLPPGETDQSNDAATSRNRSEKVVKGDFRKKKG